MNQIAIDLGSQYLGNTGHYLSNLTGVGKLVSILLSNAITIAGVILIFLLIYAGTYMQGNADNPDAVKDGQKIITYSLLGFVIVVAAYFLVNLVQTVSGVNILK